MYGKEEDRWLSLITRGMTTLTRAKRTSRIVSFLMVFGIIPVRLAARPGRDYFFTPMPSEPTLKRAVVFVDGQNLFYAGRSAFGYSYPNYDPLALSKAVCVQQGWLAGTGPILSWGARCSGRTVKERLLDEQTAPNEPGGRLCLQEGSPVSQQNRQVAGWINPHISSWSGKRSGCPARPRHDRYRISASR